MLYIHYLFHTIFTCHYILITITLNFEITAIINPIVPAAHRILGPTTASPDPRHPDTVIGRTKVRLIEINGLQAGSVRWSALFRLGAN